MSFDSKNRSDEMIKLNINNVTPEENEENLLELLQNA